MSRKITLDIPSGIVEVQDIVTLLLGKGILATLGDTYATHSMIIVDKFGVGFHHVAGNYPNFVSLHADFDPELDVIFRKIRKITGGILTTWTEEFEITEPFRRPMFSTDNGLPFMIKTCILSGDMEDENDMAGLLEYMANKSFGYSISHPMYKVLELFKK